MFRLRGPISSLAAGGTALALLALAVVGPVGAAGPSLELAAVTATPVTLDGGIMVAVTADQHVSLVGEATSLRAVLEEVCRQAGVELRGYRGPEHRYIAKLENVPLHDVFRSLLREESYVLGLRATAPSALPRIAWIRVLGGDPAGAVAVEPSRPVQPPQQTAGVPASVQEGVVAPAPAAPAFPFLLPPALLFEAFNMFDPAGLDDAQRRVVGQITDNPAAREHFLATDAKDLAGMFRPYRDAPGTVKRLQSLAVDRQVQAKLGEVVRALGEGR